MSLQVAKVKGIPIKLHFTLLIVFALIAWTLAVGFMPPLYPNIPQAAYWIMGILGAIILFVSVLLHELSHSLLSKKYGLKVRQIMLFVFGGVSDIKEESKDPKKEFKIAIVGPLSSFALAGLFAAIWFPLALTNVTGLPQEDTLFYFPPPSQEQQEAVSAGSSLADPAVALTIAEGIMRYGTIVNVLLGFFNLIPAFPLDGGRVLRAALVRGDRSREQATRTAVRVGVGISYAIMAFGFITIFTGSFIGGIWLILIGWFLQSGAQSYLQHQEITSALSGIHLRDIMNTRFVAVTADMTVKHTIDNYFNIYRKSELPVVENSRIVDDNYNQLLVGAVTAKSIFNVQDDNREIVRVADVMVEKRELTVMRPSDTADIALRRMMQENKGRIYVCESTPSFSESKEVVEDSSSAEFRVAEKKNHRLVGIISKTDILNIARERMEYIETSEKDSQKGMQKEQSSNRHFGEAA